MAAGIMTTAIIWTLFYICFVFGTFLFGAFLRPDGIAEIGFSI